MDSGPRVSAVIPVPRLSAVGVAFRHCAGSFPGSYSVSVSGIGSVSTGNSINVSGLPQQFRDRFNQE